jgi:PAS domain S-box-containing protein
VKGRRTQGPSVDTLVREVAALTARLAKAENTIIALRAAAGKRPARSGPEAGSRLESMVRVRTRDLTVLTGELHAEIRDRMRTEETLRAEKAYREAVENCLVAGIVVADSRGRHTHVNDAFCAMTGFRREELLGAGIPYPYWPPEERKACAAAMRRVLKGEIAPAGLEFRFMTRDGRSLDVLLHASQLAIAGKVAGSLASVHDITRRKRMESELRESEGRFRSLVQDLPIGVCIVRDGGVLFENPEQERLRGTLPESIPPVRTPNIHPEDAAAFEALCQGRTPADSTGGGTDLRLVRRGPAGPAEEIRWVRCKAGGVRYQGRDAILLTMMDITRARKLEGLVVAQEKLATLGQLSAGIAHEIRNPLSGINIYLSALEQLVARAVVTDPGSMEQIHEIMGQMNTASSKIASVIQRVMDLSKPTQPRLGSVDINRIVEVAVRGSLDDLRKNRISFSQELGRDLPGCPADPRLIEQVLLNLIANAVQAMASRQGPRQLEIASSVENGRIVLRVSDSGPGVPSALRAKIFDPFFTTRKEGYGIGLSFSHRVIAGHGGSLTIGVSRWGGAEFRIELPLEGDFPDSR